MRPGAKRLSLLYSSFFALWIGSTRSDDNSFDCHVDTDGYKFDLTKLTGEHVVNRTRDNPPSQMVDTVRFDLCADLKVLDDPKDQCPPGTRACLRTVNKKEGSDDRIISVIPVGQISSSKPTYSVSSSPKSLIITFSGSNYPHPINATPVQQFWDMTLFCDPEDTKQPKFLSYDGARLAVTWNTPSGCALQGEGGGTPESDKPDETAPDHPVGSGIGWFFVMLLLAFVAYFAIGAYYNYSTYGARGMDLIPHRDFWQEVPYMIREVASHLCSDVGARRASRSGYIAV